jgi:hypothetical protein
LLRKSDGAEDPNPITGRDLVTAPIGHSLVIRVTAGKMFVIGSVTVFKIGSSAPLALLLLNKANDPNLLITDAESIVMPNEPLDANS